MPSRMLRLSEDQLRDRSSKATGKPKPPAPSEHQEQVTFFQWWAAWAPTRRLDTRLCFAIPNGAKLPWRRDSSGERYSPEAIKLLRSGLTPGVLDIFMAIPRRGFHGLFIEMKAVSGKASPEQLDFCHLVACQGYERVIAYGAAEAIRFAESYLKT